MRFSDFLEAPWGEARAYTQVFIRVEVCYNKAIRNQLFCSISSLFRLWGDGKGEDVGPIQTFLRTCGVFFAWLWQMVVECVEHQTLLVIVLLLLSPFLFLLLRNVIWNSSQGLKNLLAPVIATPAKVVSRREQKVANRWQQFAKNYRFVGPMFEYARSGCTQYFITFQLEDGSTKELQVWTEIHHGVHEGDYGILTFRGDKFKSFRMSTMSAQQV